MDFIETRERSEKIFLNTMSAIIDFLYDKNQKDRTVNEFYDKFNLAKVQEPRLVVTKIGPYIWKYREPIHSTDVKFFMNNSFESDYKENLQDSSDDFQYILTLIRKTWITMNEDDKQNIINNTKKLLSNYAQIIKIEKQINAK